MTALLLVRCFGCPDWKTAARGEHEGFNRPSLRSPTGRASPQPYLLQPEERPRSRPRPGEEVTTQTRQTHYPSVGSSCAFGSDQDSLDVGEKCLHPWCFSKLKGCLSGTASLCCSKEKKGCFPESMLAFLCPADSMDFQSKWPERAQNLYNANFLKTYWVWALQQTAIRKPWQLCAPFQQPSGHGLPPGPPAPWLAGAETSLAAHHRWGSPLSMPRRSGVHPCCSPPSILRPKSHLGLRWRGQ